MERVLFSNDIIQCIKKFLSNNDIVAMNKTCVRWWKMKQLNFKMDIYKDKKWKEFINQDVIDFAGYIDYTITGIPFNRGIYIKKCIGIWRKTGKRAVSMNFETNKFSFYYPNGKRNNTIDDSIYYNGYSRHCQSSILPQWLEQLYRPNNIQTCDWYYNWNWDNRRPRKKRSRWISTKTTNFLKKRKINVINVSK